MNAERIMTAIGGISDKYIEKFADIRPCKKEHLFSRFWVKYAAVAASICLIISTVFILQNQSQYKDTARAYNMISVNEMMYEIIPSEDDQSHISISYNAILKEHGLSYPIDPASIGDRLGVYTAYNGESYALYDYKPYLGNSVLIAQGSKVELQYALFCNLDNNNFITMENLLSLYGFDSTNTVSEIDFGEQVVSNPELIENILKEMKESSISESYVDTDSAEKIEIIVKGVNSDVLKMDYYPEKNVIYRSLTFYQISSQLSLLLLKPE